MRAEYPELPTREPSEPMVAAKRLMQHDEERFLPVQYPPWESFFQDNIALSTLTAGSAFTTVYTFKVPPARRCVVRYLGIVPNDPAALAFVTFRILINGSPHRNYQAPPVLLGTIEKPALIFVPMEHSTTFELQLANSGPIYQVAHRTVSWHWDRQVYLPELSGMEDVS